MYPQRFLTTTSHIKSACLIRLSIILEILKQPQPLNTSHYVRRSFRQRTPNQEKLVIPVCLMVTAASACSPQNLESHFNEFGNSLCNPSKLVRGPWQSDQRYKDQRYKIGVLTCFLGEHMQITIELPDDIAHQLAEKTSDLAQKTLESLIVEAYRSDAINSAAVGRVLNLNSEEVENLLGQTTQMHDDAQMNHSRKQLPTIAETFNQIRQICVEEDFELELPPRRDRPNPLMADDVSF